MWASSVAFCMYGVASVSTVPADHSSQFTVLLFKRSLMWFYVLFWVLLSELVIFSGTQEVASRSVSRTISLCWFLLPLLLLSFSCSFMLTDCVWFALNSLPSPPLPSTVNKQPEPAPRRANAVNRKQPQLTSPTFQPPLPPLEAWVPAQLEPQPQVPSLATEAEQPGLSGGGGVGGGLSGGVQVATVKPQVVTQLSAEESR